MTKFTIITITYNAAEVLQPTLDSVLSQDYTAVEHWIIDGDSTDGTVELVRKYAERNRQSGSKHVVRMQSEPDSGLYYAMNKGLDKATGDYILFLNAGDRLAADDTLSRVAEAIGQCDRQPAVAYGDTDIIDAEGHFLGHRHLSAPRKLTWRSFLHGMTVCHQAFYALTEIAREKRYDTRFRHSADIDWCIRVMKEGQRQGRPNKKVGRVVALFLAGGDSAQSHKASLRERFEVMKRHYGLLPTVVMHAWFLLRAAGRKLTGRSNAAA